MIVLAVSKPLASERHTGRRTPASPCSRLFDVDRPRSGQLPIGNTTGDVHRRLAGIFLPPHDRDIDIFGIEFDPAGNLYISDTINSRILRVAK